MLLFEARTERDEFRGRRKNEGRRRGMSLDTSPPAAMLAGRSGDLGHESRAARSSCAARESASWWLARAAGGRRGVARPRQGNGEAEGAGNGADLARGGGAEASRRRPDPLGSLGVRPWRSPVQRKRAEG